MEHWLALALALLPVGIALWERLSRWPPARLTKLWRDAAGRVGLTRVVAYPDSLVGWAGPVYVRLSCDYSAIPRPTEITVGGPTLPAGLTIRPERDLLTHAAVFSALREVEVGDDEFDAVAWVEGPPALAHAVLDRSARRALQALFAGRLERPGRTVSPVSGRLENGTLEITVSRAGVDHLAEVLEGAIHVGRLLASTAEVPRRIADNLKDEPMAGVRLRSLGVLACEYPDDPGTRGALLAAREDPAPEVRLLAGIALGPEGRDVLRAIAAETGLPDETTSQAVAALEPDLTVEEATGLLRNALARRHPATAKACMMALGRRGGAEAIEALAGVLGSGTVELGEAAAQALATTHDVAAEGPLLRSLAEGALEVQLAAAAALGEVGTTAAVEPLREAEEGDRRMRRAARQAIAEIQSRLAGAERGQLSIAGGESGRLSMAEGEAGSLSLAGGKPAEGPR